MKSDKVKANAPYYLWKLSNRLYLLKIPVLPLFIKVVLRFVFGAVIPPQTKIGKNVHFAHLGMGIVLHKDVVIGDNVQINQHVTIGGRVGSGAPKVGDNVLIGAGAKVLGNIVIGDNANIGANAVVITDVPPGATAVGVPAKIIER